MIIPQPDRILIRKFISSAAAGYHQVVLDLGSGDGKRYRDLIECGQYLTLDIDSSKSPSIVADASAIPLPNSSVDLIICSQLLEHVRNPRSVVSEIHRVLKKHGILILTTPLFNEIHEEPNDFFRFTSFGLQELLGDGFEIQVVTQRGGFVSLVLQIAARVLLIKSKEKRMKLGLRILGGVLGRIVVWHTIGRNRNPVNSELNRRFTIGYSITAKKY